MTEAENRNTRGFDFATPNPIQAQAQAQFAANPPAGVPLTAAQFAVLGGYQYVDDANRRIWDCRHATTSSRGSASPTRSTPTIVVRGGAGLFISPFQINAVPGLGNPVNQLGYSRQTPVPVTLRQRPDVPGEPDQSGAERAAPAAERLVALGLSRPTSVASLASDHPEPIGPTPNTGASASASRSNSPNNWLVELSYLGQKGSQHADRRAGATTCRSSSARRARFATTPRRRSSARSCPIPSRG